MKQRRSHSTSKASDRATDPSTVHALSLTIAIILSGIALAPVGGTASAQDGATAGEWRHYAGDSGSSKYSALDQIDADNFEQLEVAWRWESADKKLEGKVPYEPGHFRATPLMIGGVLYTPTGLSQVAALDAATGEELWVYDPKSYERGKVVHTLVQIRGLESWTDGDEVRILIATGGRQLVSIDGKTGKPDREFGEDGIVDLTQDLGRKVIANNIGHSAPVIVVGDVIVVGSLIFDFPTRDNSPPGHVRAYDVRTGKFKWRFHSIPQEGEKYTDTWEGDSWKTAGNTNVWTMMSADQELGYVYLPFGTPTNDYYGGHRHGDNVYAESLVCVDVATGEPVWHFQAVHHGIACPSGTLRSLAKGQTAKLAGGQPDYDFASAPNLIDITVAGKRIKAVAQVSKQGFTYVFDRVTGEPVWPIEERPVNHFSTVPGEKLAKTQPFPTKPPAFESQGATVDDLIDFTPELRAEALEIAKEYVLGPIFTPSIVSGTDGKKSTIVNPGAGGGASWPGASIDPERGLLYVQSMTNPVGLGVAKPDAARSDWNYVIDFQRIPGPRGLPLLKPPYRRITAIDLWTGEHAWQIPFGEGPTQHAAIEHLNLGPLGSPFPQGVISEGGLLITKTLLITFQAQLDELGDRKAKGSYLEAYDKATGKRVARIEVDRSLHSSPMTYSEGGRQFIVVAGGGRDEKAELVAFALGETE